MGHNAVESAFINCLMVVEYSLDKRNPQAQNCAGRNQGETFLNDWAARRELSWDLLPVSVPAVLQVFNSYSTSTSHATA